MNALVAAMRRYGRRYPPSSGRRVLYGVTVPSTALAFLCGQLQYLTERSWEVHLLCGAPGAERFGTEEHVCCVHVVPANRDPSWRDPLTVARTWWLLRRLRPDIVVMGTPKMGILGTLSARMAGVPSRIYLVHGYRAEGLTGPMLLVMRSMERLGGWCATEVVAVSSSLRELLIEERVAPKDKITVLGAGSANGVDTLRFSVPDSLKVAAARESLGLPPGVPVVSVVARMSTDKGLLELCRIWQLVTCKRPQSRLVLAGTPELRSDEEQHAYRHLLQLPGVQAMGFIGDVERVYQASDALLMLSSREGLGMVCLEAAACGVPTVGYSATGVDDAVVHGETGVLVRAHDHEAVASALIALLADQERRDTMGVSARQRVETHFARDDVWERWDALLGATASTHHEGTR